jgi:hypothetical protein
MTLEINPADPPAAETDVFARSVRQETREGPALPGGLVDLSRPSWEELAAAFAAEREAEARHKGLRDELKERQADFEEEVADLRAFIKEAKEEHAARLAELKELGKRLSARG